MDWKAETRRQTYTFDISKPGVKTTNLSYHHTPPVSVRLLATQYGPRLGRCNQSISTPRPCAVRLPVLLRVVGGNGVRKSTAARLKVAPACLRQYRNIALVNGARATETARPTLGFTRDGIHTSFLRILLARINHVGCGISTLFQRDFTRFHEFYTEFPRNTDFTQTYNGFPFHTRHSFRNNTFRFCAYL